MKFLVKKVIFFILYYFLPRRTQKASVLMYHSVGTSKAFFTVRPQDFERQLQYLAKHREIIFLSELFRKIEEGESIARCAVLTFDDAYSDMYTMVYPLLKKYNVPATLFVPTGHIGGTLTTSDNVTLSIVSKSMLLDMVKSGLVECMPHTETHQTLGGLSREELHRELEDSYWYLQKYCLGTERILAYPKGVYTDNTCRYLKEHGWRGAVTVNQGLVDVDDPVFEICRNSIDSKTAWVQFKANLNRTIEWYTAIRS